MSDEHPKNNNGRKWVAWSIPVFAAIIAVLGFMYAVGQRTSRIVEVVDWKNETAPRIERMDAQGTISFKLFHEEYLRTQHRQEEWLQKIERDVHEKELEELRSRIQALEKKP